MSVYLDGLSGVLSLLQRHVGGQEAAIFFKVRQIGEMQPLGSNGLELEEAIQDGTSLLAAHSPARYPA